MTINCRAIKNGELFVTANGDVLPCCYIYRGGPNLIDSLADIAKEKNFDSLVKSWNSDNPHPICLVTCGDNQQTHPLNMKNFYKQWKNS